MCNKLHEDSVAIPESGVAWKLFRRSDPDCKGSYFRDDPYIIDKDGWVTWRWAGGRGFGFCAFSTKEEAERYAATETEEDWEGDENYFYNPQIRKINYRGGLGKHMESLILFGYLFETVIVKAFRVVRDGE